MELDLILSIATVFLGLAIIVYGLKRDKVYTWIKKRVSSN